ncbi:MAG: hypothetical protein H6502_00790 [Candidatus Woesearchaeota archaeon]|nr:MAG: hypothetical protein H6502_00790 [Candidatus Woesearchaeota archaeon]
MASKKERKKQLEEALFVAFVVIAGLAVISMLGSPVGTDIRGLATGDPPADPGLQKNYEGISGLLPPEDYYDDTYSPFLHVIGNSNTELDIRFQLADGLHHTTMYYLTSANTWQSMAAYQLHDSSDDWSLEELHAHLLISNIASNVANNKLIVAVYGCKLVSDEWKCGCAAPDDCGYWTGLAIDLPTGGNGGGGEIS